MSTIVQKVNVTLTSELENIIPFNNLKVDLFFLFVQGKFCYILGINCIYEILVASAPFFFQVRYVQLPIL